MQGVSPARMEAMMDDLKAIKEEMLPHAKLLDVVDNFMTCKRQLNESLRGVRNHINTVRERKQNGPSARDEKGIKLQHKLREELKLSSSQFDNLRNIFVTDEQRKGTQRLPDDELRTRKKAVELLGEELEMLTSQVYSGRAFKPNSLGEKEMQERVEKRRRERMSKLERTRPHRNNNGDKKRNSVQLTEIKTEEPIDEHEVAFGLQVEDNKREQDVLLGHISDGLTELHEIALGAGRELEHHEELLTELIQTTQTATVNLRTANRRLRGLLEDTGGTARWCGRSVCLVVLLALVGLIVHLTTT